MNFIDKEEINASLSFKVLIEALREAFANSGVVVPMRHHHDYENPREKTDSTLLLMPAWLPGEDLGVKIVTVSPRNSQFGLPSIQGLYILFDAHTGNFRALLDAKSITVKRTAAASALASSYLSRENSKSLLMIGTGALAPKLIQAHATVRGIEQVYVWGRNFEKAAAVCALVRTEKIKAEPVADLETAIGQADIISCATMSEEPLIKGAWLREGQHLDMVGAYRPHMREADDEVIARADVFVDHYKGALKETGDIVIPVAKGLLRKEDIKADLFELCSGSKKGRTNDKDITFFKSVGHALEDLVAARLVVDNLNKN